jgi:hypothetical protein
MQLVWYLASSVFSVGGFLSLYGFITNNECKDNSFYSIRNYLMECGSSMHFVIPAIVFGFCLASFPFTASFIAKSNITKFFVDETWLYFTLKASTVIFIMFAIKLILPVCYSVEFFKLDKRGRKLASILYMFVFLLMLINVAFFIISKVKINIFIFSVEFFTFIAYTCIAGVLLFMLEFVLKASNAKKIIEVAVQDLNYFRIEFFNIIQTTKAKSIKNIERITTKRKKMKEVLVLSKITPSASISFILILIIAFLTNKFL